MIYVITKDNFEIDGTRVGARYGSFDTYDAWLQHGGEYKNWDIRGGFEFQKSDGDRDRIIDSDDMNALGLAAFSNTPGYIDTGYEVATSHLGFRRDNVTLQIFGSMLESAIGPGALQAITYDNDLDETDILVDLERPDKDYTLDWDLGVGLYHIYMQGDIYYEILPKDYLNMIGNPILTDNNSGI